VDVLLVQDVKILVRNLITLIVLNGHSSPMALNAAFFQEVTMFQPIRPLVKRPSVLKRLANRKGGSKDVEAVIPNARLLVTAAIAVIG
jgi:hypothetical protein